VVGEADRVGSRCLKIAPHPGSLRSPTLPFQGRDNRNRVETVKLAVYLEVK